MGESRPRRHGRTVSENWRNVLPLAPRLAVHYVNSLKKSRLWSSLSKEERAEILAEALRIT
jgi:hypothetical protein